MGALIGLTDEDAELVVKALRSYEDPKDRYILNSKAHNLADYIETTIGSITQRKKSDE